MEYGVTLDQAFRILVITDYDPQGYKIQGAAKEHLERAGIRRVTIERVYLVLNTSRQASLNALPSRTRLRRVRHRRQRLPVRFITNLVPRRVASTSDAPPANSSSFTAMATASIMSHS